MNKKIKEAVFKYSLIQDAILKLQVGGRITSQLKKIAKNNHLHPIKGWIKMSLPTLFRYLRLYRTGEIDALMRKNRSDKGKGRRISEDTIQKAINLRKDNPGRTTEKLIKILKDEYNIIGIKHSTLDYHLDNKGYSRRQLKSYDTKIHIRFESKLPNDLWIGDYHDKRYLISLHCGKLVHLSAFIDCHSRYIVHAQYYLSEDIMTLEDSFKKAIIKWGTPKRIFVDNAKIYHSYKFSYACEKLGAKQIFSKVYVKESRGKIEKFFEYVKYNFEQEALHRGGFESLDELNKHFSAWLELDYHQRIHSEIKTTPHKRYTESLQKRPADISILHELFMVIDKRIVNKKTCVVNVMGKQFQTESFLAGRKVSVHYNPNDLSYVLIYYNDRFIHRAYAQEWNKKIPSSSQYISSDLMYDYLAALEGKYQQFLGKHLIPLEIASQDKNTEKTYGYVTFEKDIQNILRKLSKEDKKKCHNFYNTYTPFDRQVIIKGLTYAKEKLKNEKYDINRYFSQLKVFILNERSK